MECISDRSDFPDVVFPADNGLCFFIQIGNIIDAKSQNYSMEIGNLKYISFKACDSLLSEYRTEDSGRFM